MVASDGSGGLQSSCRSARAAVENIRQICQNLAKSPSNLPKFPSISVKISDLASRGRPDLRLQNVEAVDHSHEIETPRRVRVELKSEGVDALELRSCSKFRLK